jgi:multiple sugar transport system permease protein
VFVAFAVYPIGYALWMGSKPSLYVDLIDDPLYLKTAVNTLLFAGLGVNLRTRPGGAAMNRASSACWPRRSR